MFQRILVPLDGSDLAEQALAAAERLRARGAVLHLVRVNPASSSPPTPYAEMLQVEAESYLDFVVSRLAERGTAAQWETRCGEVVSEIVAASREHSCDLVAISSHGRSGMTRAVFGSVADRVLHGAEVPTLLVRAPAGAPARPDRIETILVPIDGTPVSERALEPAARLARDQGARVLLLYVVESLWAAGDSALAREQLKEVQRVADRLRQLAETLRAEKVAARSLLLRGDPSTELLAQAARHKADLVVMTPSGAGDRPTAFGNVSEKVLRGAPMPVLVVRSPAK